MSGGVCGAASPDPSPGVGAQVGEGCAGHAGPEVGAPAPQHPVQPKQQDFQRLVRADLPAQRLDLAGHGLDGLARRVGVDVGPAGASFAVTLDAPAQKTRPSSMWVISVFSGDRRRPIADKTPAISSRRASASALGAGYDQAPVVRVPHQAVVGQTLSAALGPLVGAGRGSPGAWAMCSSRTERATLLSSGERIDPCGVPVSVVPQDAVLAEDARLEERLHQGQDAFVSDASRTRSMRADARFRRNRL